MRPIIPNPKNDLRKIHDAITELTKVVGEIKSMLMDEFNAPHGSAMEKSDFKDNDEKKSN